MPGHKLINTAHTVIILSIIGTDSFSGPSVLHVKKSIGKIPDKIVNFLRSRPITLST